MHFLIGHYSLTTVDSQLKLIYLNGAIEILLRGETSWVSSQADFSSGTEKGQQSAGNTTSWQMLLFKLTPSVILFLGE